MVPASTQIIIYHRMVNKMIDHYHWVLFSKLWRKSSPQLVLCIDLFFHFNTDKKGKGEFPMIRTFKNYPDEHLSISLEELLP